MTLTDIATQFQGARAAAQARHRDRDDHLAVHCAAGARRVAGAPDEQVDFLRLAALAAIAAGYRGPQDDASDWWMAAIEGHRKQLHPFAHGEGWEYNIDPSEPAGYTIRGVWSLSLRLCHILLSEGARTTEPRPVSEGRLHSEEWRALRDDFRALSTEQFQSYSRSKADPLYGTFGPEYQNDDSATICLVGWPPRFDIDGGTAATRAKCLSLASRAATQLGHTLGYTDVDNWTAWLAHLWREMPEAWSYTDGESYRSAEANTWPDAFNYPPGPWRTVTRAYTLGDRAPWGDGDDTRTLLDCCAQACEAQHAEALRMERTPRRPAADEWREIREACEARIQSWRKRSNDIQRLERLHVLASQLGDTESAHRLQAQLDATQPVFSPGDSSWYAVSSLWRLSYGTDDEYDECRRLASRAAMLRGFSGTAPWPHWFDYLAARADAHRDDWPATGLVQRVTLCARRSKAKGGYLTIDDVWHLFALCADECERDAFHLIAPTPSAYTAAPVRTATAPATEPPTPPASNGRPQCYPGTLAYAMERCGLSPQGLAHAVAEAINADAARHNATATVECNLDSRTVQRWLTGRMPRKKYRPWVVDVLNAREGFEFHEIFPPSGS